MAQATRPFAFSSNTAMPRLVLGRIQRLPDLSCLQGWLNGWRETASDEFHTEIAACDAILPWGYHAAGRHRLCTIFLTQGDQQRAVLTHTECGKARVRFYCLENR